MIDRSKADAALKLARAGSTAPVALVAAGVPSDEVEEYLRDPAIAAGMAQAEAKVQAVLLARIIADESTAGARWYMENRYPEDWRRGGRAATAAKATPEPQAAPAPGTTAEDRAVARRARLRLATRDGDPA